MTYCSPIAALSIALMAALAAAALAHGAQITVDCTRRLGEAAQISDWMGAGGVIGHLHDPAVNYRDHLFAQVWRRAGFRYVTFEALVGFGGDSNEWHLNLSRDQAGKLVIDFAPWDHLLHTAYFCLESEPVITFSFTPRELSKHPEHREYAECMPRDLKEWQDFCEQVVQHTVRWGDENVGPGATRGLYYGPVDEPDWQGYRDDPDGPQTEAKANSVLYYAASYRGIKQADPTAKVGGPRHGQWQHPVPEGFGAAFSFKEWLQEYKRYVDANPDVHLDFVSWQDYHYYFEGPDLSDGAEAVRGYLRELGFSSAETVPLMLGGGTGCGTWSDDYTDGKKPKYQMAAYAAHNIIREFRAGTAGRKFGRAEYFYFCQSKHRPPAETYHSALTWRDDSKGPESLEITPIFAAFEMLKRVIQQDGPGAQIVQTDATAALDAMATFSWYPALVMTNYSDQARDVEIRIKLPADYGETEGWKQLRACVQRIDERHSNDGAGLESDDACWRKEPLPMRSESAGGGKCVELSLNGEEELAPWATVLVRLRP